MCVCVHMHAWVPYPLSKEEGEIRLFRYACMFVYFSYFLKETDIDQKLVNITAHRASLKKMSNYHSEVGSTHV